MRQSIPSRHFRTYRLSQVLNALAQHTSTGWRISFRWWATSPRGCGWMPATAAPRAPLVSGAVLHPNPWFLWVQPPVHSDLRQPLCTPLAPPRPSSPKCSAVDHSRSCKLAILNNTLLHFKRAPDCSSGGRLPSTRFEVPCSLPVHRANHLLRQRWHL